MAALRVTEAFTCFRTNPYGDTYNEGQIVDDKDPAVKGRSAYFETVEAASSRRVNSVRVEQATAAPGERRAVDPKPDPASASGDPARGDDDLARTLRDNNVADGTDEGQGKQTGSAEENPTQGLQTDDVPADKARRPSKKAAKKTTSKKAAKK